MMRAALMGLLASGIVAVSLSAQTISRALPVFVLALIVVVATVLQWWKLERRPIGRIYEGLTDLLLQIHTSSIPDLAWRWGIRGVISLMLALMGGLAGAEGPAIELVYALSVQLRSRSERWFEQRRRTDAACALAAGISAAFGAPFAGFLVPIEMGIGGRMLSLAMSAICAFLGIRILNTFFSIRILDLGGALYGFSLGNPKLWLGVFAIAFLASVIGLVLIRLFRFCQKGFLDLSQGQGWVRMLQGGLALVVIVSFYKSHFIGNAPLLEEMIWSKRMPWESAVAFCAKALSLAVVLSSFGTLGIFWPLFSLGGLLGYTVYEAGFQNVSGFGAGAALIGAAALWGAVLEIPLAAGVLIYELTQNIEVMIPSLGAAFLAQYLIGLVPDAWSLGFVEESLQARGLQLSGGRSVSVLQGIQVKEAMVADHETVHEHEPVSELQAKLMRSRYPYLAVVDHQGFYKGMLTLDMVREAWYTDRTVTSSHSSLSKLLEVKDLLYRAGFVTPTVREDQKLSEVSRLMDRNPCVSVVDDQGRVCGILLVQNMRQAYDREVVRRSLDFSVLKVEE